MLVANVAIAVTVTGAFAAANSWRPAEVVATVSGAEPGVANRCDVFAITTGVVPAPGTVQVSVTWDAIGAVNVNAIGCPAASAAVVGG